VFKHYLTVIWEKPYLIDNISFGRTVSVLKQNNSYWIAADSSALGLVKGPFKTYDDVVSYLTCLIAPLNRVVSVYIETNEQLIKRTRIDTYQRWINILPIPV
jgi:hypothetical protein